MRIRVPYEKSSLLSVAGCFYRAGGGVAKPLGPPPKALFYSLLVVLIAFIPAMFEFAFRIRYPTLRYGIVLVTGRAYWHVV
jgi:hypothetical protein